MTNDPFHQKMHYHSVPRCTLLILSDITTMIYTFSFNRRFLPVVFYYTSIRLLLILPSTTENFSPFSLFPQTLGLRYGLRYLNNGSLWNSTTGFTREYFFSFHSSVRQRFRRYCLHYVFMIYFLFLSFRLPVSRKANKIIELTCTIIREQC